jgi:exodeoxyribonuclease VII small subunit
MARPDASASLAADPKAETLADQVESARPANFEQAIEELESLVRQMESGELSLESSLAAYRRGAELASFCRQTLARVQQQVRVLEADLLKVFEPGEEESA